MTLFKWVLISYLLGYALSQLSLITHLGWGKSLYQSTTHLRQVKETYFLWLRDGRKSIGRVQASTLFLGQH